VGFGHPGITGGFRAVELTIVKPSVDLPGGAIMFESIEGEGTTGTIMLPRNAVQDTSG
jgi:signal transduction histidine kinase